MIKIYYFLFFLLVFLKTQSQVSRQNDYSHLSDQELLKIYDTSQNSDLIKRISKIYLQRSKSENDIEKIARGYDLLARLYDFKTNIRYADSIINVSQNLKNNKHYPAMGYLLKAAYYYSLDDYQNSFDNYKSSQEYILNDDFNKILAIRFGIAAIKDRWAIADVDYSLQTLKLIEQQKDFEKNFKEEYFNIINNIGHLYLDAGNSTLAKNYFTKAKMLLDKDSNGVLKNLNILSFAKLELTNEHYLKALNYYKSVEIEGLDNGEIANYYINLGATHRSLNNINETMRYYLKVDSLYVNFNVLPSDLPLVYNSLALKAAKTKDLNKHRYYTEKLIEVNYKINNNIKKINFKMYDSNILDFFQTKLTKTFWQTNTFKYLVIIVFVLVLIVIFILFNKKLVTSYLSVFYVNSFLIDFTQATTLHNEIALNNFEEEPITDISRGNQIRDIGISELVIDHILSGLKSFEKEKMFLKIGGLKEVSGYINTNSSYLSKVINFYKKRTFSLYIHELRISEAVVQLKDNQVLQSYTIDAISKEFGYNSAESFSKAFKKIVGIYPSKFIKENNLLS